MESILSAGWKGRTKMIVESRLGLLISIVGLATLSGCSPPARVATAARLAQPPSPDAGPIYLPHLFRIPQARPTATPSPRPTPHPHPTAYPTSFPEWMPDAEFVLGGPAMAVDVVGDVAFTAIGVHLVALDISRAGDPPALGASPPLPGTVMDVKVSDGFAYVTVAQLTELDDAYAGLFVLDVSDPTSIEIVGRKNLFQGATKLAVNGDIAMVFIPRSISPSSDGFLVAYDVSDPKMPTSFMTIPYVPGSNDFVIVERTLLLCLADHLYSLDLTRSMESPDMIELATPCSALGVSEEGTVLAVASDADSDVTVQRFTEAAREPAVC